MQRQIFNSDHEWLGNLAGRFGAILAMAGLLLLSACDGGGKSVTDNNLAEPGKDGIPPTLTSVTIEPDKYVALGALFRITIDSSEALMTPVVTINGVRANVSGSVNRWFASRVFTEADTVGPISFSIVYQDVSGEVGDVVLTTTDGKVAEYCAEDCPVDLGPLEGKWRLDRAGVGPVADDITWWNTDAGGVREARACWFDDLYEFDADGSFKNIQGGETWLETWQGVAAESCGAPVAPHDGSNNAIFEYDEDAGTLKLTGVGAYLGLAKAVNNAELADPALAPESVTYTVVDLTGDSLRVTIDVGAGDVWWTFELSRISNHPLVGKWKLSLDEGAGVGPVSGDITWWNTNAGGVVDARACWFDDIYHFGDDGSFQNYQGGETWLEPWQGVAAESCGAPVAPHDGSTAGTWTHDEEADTLRLDGLGSYLGLAKAVNGAELGDPANAPDSVTYDVLSLDGDELRVTIDVAAGDVWWTFKLERVTDTADLRGKWQLNTDPNSPGAGVGPVSGDITWWNTAAGGVVETRACWFDDVFEFGRDGSFANEQGGETWLETWQGVAAESCGAPVAPHDGSARSIFEFDADAGKLTIYGLGAHLGLAKAVNGAELADPADAPESVTYDVLSLVGDNLVVTVETAPDVWWTFDLVRSSNSPFVGNWKLDTDEGAGVGPVSGDITWWNTNAGGVVEARACWFDDVYHFGGDGSFQNFQAGETWLEPWQGVAAESCGVPLAPHDGSSAGRFAYDSAAQTLTLLGTGSHLGLAKAVNNAELADPLAAPETVTYDVLDIDGDLMRVTIDVAAGDVWWTFKLRRD